MKAVLRIDGIIGEDTTLKDVIRQLKSYEEPTSVEVKIHSEGGGVEQGEAIYSYLRNLGLPITTITGKAYSIAAHIFMAGDIRIVEDVEDVLMIHFAWVDGIAGNADDLEAVVELLRETENEFAKFYSDIVDIDEDTVRELLGAETYLSGSEAVEMGFATEKKEAIKAVARFDINKFSNLNQFKMSKKENALIKALRGYLKPEVKALVLQDSDGTEIDFPDVEAGNKPQVGDKAEVDGSPIKDGSYIIPSLDNAKYTFEGGTVSEIVEAETEEEAEPTEEAQAKAKTKAKAKVKAEKGAETESEEGSEVKAEEIKEIMLWEMEVVNTSFAVGDVVEYEYDGNNYSVGAGEYQLKDGRRIVTDSSGSIVTIKESGATEEVEIETTTEAKETEEVEAQESEVVALLKAMRSEFKKENDALKAELKTVKKSIGSKEIEVQGREPSTSTPAPQKKKPLGAILSGR